MCGGDAPDPPDMTRMAEAMEANAELFAQLGMDQLDWSKAQWGDQKALLDRVLDSQLAISDEQLANARKDRARYDETFRPIEDDLIKEFEGYASGDRIERQAGRAASAVTSAAAAQREEASRRLESYGIDPSQIRAGGIDLQARMMTAANAAGAANNERDRVENMGRALRAEAINIGKGLPSQVAGSYGQTLSAGNSAVGNMNNTVATGANTLNSAQGWMQMGNNAISGAANITNMGYQNELAGYQANQSLGGVGQLAGTAIGAFMESGGEVPGDAKGIPGKGDKYPVVLAEDEYVIPAEVVKWKGLEFFDRLTAKSRKAQGLPEQPAGVPIQGPQAALPNGMNAGGQVPWDMPVVNQTYDPVQAEKAAIQLENNMNSAISMRERIAAANANDIEESASYAMAGKAMKTAYKDRKKEKEDKKSNEPNTVST